MADRKKTNNYSNIYFSPTMKKTMENMPVKEEVKTPAKKKFKLRKFLFKLSLLTLTLLFVGYLFDLAAAWGADHKIEKRTPVVVKFQSPIVITKREKIQVVEVIEKAYIKQETPIEQKICDKFGVEECKVAVAVAKGEGLNHPVDGFNINTNGTIDVGIFRINSVHFDKPECTLDKVITVDGNINCAYHLWSKQGWDIWVAYTNGSFVKHL